MDSEKTLGRSSLITWKCVFVRGGERRYVSVGCAESGVTELKVAVHRKREVHEVIRNKLLGKICLVHNH